MALDVSQQRLRPGAMPRGRCGGARPEHRDELIGVRAERLGDASPGYRRMFVQRRVDPVVPLDRCNRLLPDGGRRETRRHLANGWHVEEDLGRQPILSASSMMIPSGPRM